jgi:HEAT repeat protein
MAGAKRFLFVLAPVALIVLGAALMASWPRIVEEWNIAQLESGDEARQKAATRKLSEMRSARAVPRLVLRLRAEAPELFASGLHGGPEEIEREFPAAYALGRIGAPAVPALVAAYGEGDRFTQFAVLQSFYAMDPPGEALMRALSPDGPLGSSASAILKTSPADSPRDR